mgnify:CR=1
MRLGIMGIQPRTTPSVNSVPDLVFKIAAYQSEKVRNGLINII